MKRLPILLFSVISFLGSAQILFVPSGTAGISTSTTTGVGIGLNNPQGRLDVKATGAFGGIQVFTTTQLFPNIGGPDVEASTPYAFKVQYQNSINFPATDITVALMDAYGKLNLGDFNGITPTSTNYLNIRSALGIYSNATNKLELKTENSGTNIIWNTTATNTTLAPFAENLNFIFNSGVPIASFNKNGLSLNTQDNANESFALNVSSTQGNIFRLANNGKLYLGENLNGNDFEEYRLYVETGIRTERIRVDIATENGWADFVFDDDYELMSTQELADYIAINKHLPNVPSEKQVREEGIDLAEMNAILLRQIEELTLRVIELEKAQK